MDSTPSSKVIEFLAFQITQNKHNGPSCHATFLFLPTKESFQPKRVSFTESGKTQKTPKKKEEQRPHLPCSFTMKEEVVNRLPTLLAQKAPISQSLTPLLRAVQG